MPTKLGTAEVIPSNGLTYAFGAFRLIPKQRKLLLADEAVQLSSRAFDILVVLIELALLGTYIWLVLMAAREQQE